MKLSLLVLLQIAIAVPDVLSPEVSIDWHDPPHVILTINRDGLTEHMCDESFHYVFSTPLFVILEGETIWRNTRTIMDAENLRGLATIMGEEAKELVNDDEFSYEVTVATDNQNRQQVQITVNKILQGGQWYSLFISAAEKQPSVTETTDLEVYEMKRYEQIPRSQENVEQLAEEMGNEINDALVKQKEDLDRLEDLKSGSAYPN